MLTFYFTGAPQGGVFRYFILPKKQFSQLQLLYCSGLKSMATELFQSRMNSPSLAICLCCSFHPVVQFIAPSLNSRLDLWLLWQTKCGRNDMVQIPSVELRLETSLDMHLVFTSFVSFNPPHKETSLASWRASNQGAPTGMHVNKASWTYQLNWSSSYCL